MATEEYYNKLSESITDLEREQAINLVNKAIDENYNLLAVVEQGLGKGIRKLGDLWENDEIFLPELMMGGNIIEECINLVTPHLKSNESIKQAGKVVIGTIEGDIHSIGKTIVGTMLKAYRFEVYDLGVDVSPERLIQEAIDKNVDIIGVSALLTTTMIRQKDVVELLKDKGIRDKFKIILGGAPVTERWVEECGADGFAESAIAAVELAKKLQSS